MAYVSQSRLEFGDKFHKTASLVSMGRQIRMEDSSLFEDNTKAYLKCISLLSFCAFRNRKGDGRNTKSEQKHHQLKGIIIVSRGITLTESADQSVVNDKLSYSCDVFKLFKEQLEQQVSHEKFTTA